MEFKFTKENFEEEVLKSDIPVMVDFYADWCGPCQMMMPVVKELSEKYGGKVKIGRVNTDEEQELAAEYGIMSIPTFCFIKNGEITDTAIGGMGTAALEKKIEALL